MPVPRAVLFDAYGTLFDVYSVGALTERLFPGQGAALGLLWREKQIEYTRLVSASDGGRHYRPFWDLTRAGLRYACKRLKLDLTEAFEEQLMQQYLQLTPYPENIEVLQALRARGIPTGVLSNGSPHMLAGVVQSAGLASLLDHVLSVDTVRKFKTHPEAYALGPQALGMEVGEIAFVSSNAWDALCATWYGYQTLWVNRAGLPFEELGTQPTRSGADLRAVLGFFPDRKA